MPQKSQGLEGPDISNHHMDVSENNGGTPKSSILIGLSIINHPFWGTTIFGNIHLVLKDVEGLLIDEARDSSDSWDVNLGNSMKFLNCEMVFVKGKFDSTNWPKNTWLDVPGR